MGNERSRNHEAWRGIEARLGHRDSRFGKNFVRFLRVGHDLLMHRLEHHLLKLRGLGVWVRECASASYERKDAIAQQAATHSSKDLNMSLFTNVSERFARYQETRRTMRELSRLSDRDLQDLGISRTAIPKLARTGKRF